MSKAAAPLSSATTATSSSARTISAAAAAAEQRYIDRSAWLTFTSSNALSARGSRRNDLLPQLYDVASQRSPPQKNSARKGTSTVTNEPPASSASPMTRANNSWYASERSYERIDKIATHQISFDQNPERSGKRDVSSAARARKLKQTDPFSTSRDPAFTSASIGRILTAVGDFGILAA
jgi:hypothetical protein